MATTIETPYARRARYYSSADGFNIKRSRIRAHVFSRERASHVVAFGRLWLSLGATSWVIPG